MSSRLLLVLVGMVTLGSCDSLFGGGDGDGDKGSVSFTDESSGTLTVSNNTLKDMVLFQGQTPQSSNILGGIRATSTRTFDIEDDVSDFAVGGYIILRGMSIDEYNANKSNLTNAKAEFSAMATYGQGKKFRTEINPAWAGDYYFKLTNGGKIGMELRKNSPDGEKIGYLPALATNYALYSTTTDDMTIFPVYVYYSATTKTVTTIRASSFGESVGVAPRSVTDSTVAAVRLPNDASLTWDQIANAIIYPVAFVTCINNISNQSSRLQVASTYYKAQNGYDSMNSGESLTFEVQATEGGQVKALNVSLYGGTCVVPVTMAGGSVTLKNGYDYSLTLDYVGGNADLTNAANYTAVITEDAKRSVKEEIISL
jgi:hypothetical protein